MEATFKTTLKQVMSLAWQFVRKNGLSLSDALIKKQLRAMSCLTGKPL